jgi:hypothetical protein
MSIGRSCATILFSSRLQAQAPYVPSMENQNRFLNRPELPLDSKSAQRDRARYARVHHQGVWHTGVGPILSSAIRERCEH